MRVRILKPSAGVIDGVSLGHLKPGLAYDLSAETAHFLILQGCAEQLPAISATPVIPVDNPTAFAVLTGGVTVSGLPPAGVLDRRPRRTKKR